MGSITGGLVGRALPVALAANPQLVEELAKETAAAIAEELGLFPEKRDALCELMLSQTVAHGISAEHVDQLATDHGRGHIAVFFWSNPKSTEIQKAVGQEVHGDNITEIWRWLRGSKYIARTVEAEFVLDVDETPEKTISTAMTQEEGGAKVAELDELIRKLMRRRASLKAQLLASS